MVWLEVLGITALILFSGYWIDGEDVFFIGVEFPWLWLAPLLVALMHGVIYGISSALMLICSTSALIHFQFLEPPEYPLVYSMGMMSLTLLCGEFSDVWSQRIASLSATSKYLSDRVKEMERSYLFIKISHDHLEKECLKKPLSLHSHSINIRDQLSQLQSNQTALSELESLSEQLIQLFVTFGYLSEVSLHSVSDELNVKETPLASVGSVIRLNKNDPLLVEALRRKKVVSLSETQRKIRGEAGRLLVVVPIVDLEKKIWAILAIKKMPFWAFHLNNLQVLAVIGNHIGDLLLGRIREGRDVQKSHVFVSELKRCILDRRRYGLEATLLEFRFRSDVRTKTLKKWIFKHRLGLSVVVSRHRENRDIGVLMLLPLMGEKNCQLYLKKLESELKNSFGFNTFRAAGIELVWRSVRSSDQCKAVLRELFSLPPSSDMSFNSISEKVHN